MRWLGCVLLLAGTVWAQSAEETQALVRELVKQGKPIEAATRLGRALRRAQNKRDLLLEQALADILRVEFASLDPMELPTTKGGYRDTCHALMKQLDAGRGGAFVSAHQLAAELIFQCVRGGDDRHLKDAAAVAGKFAKRRDAGAFARAMASLGEGVVLARKRKHEKALTKLNAAFAEFTKDQWFIGSGYAAVELEASLTALGMRKEASGIALKMLTLLMKREELAAGTLYSDAMLRRRGGGPPGLVERFKELEGQLRDSLDEPESASDAPDPSLGAAWEGHPASKPVASVTLESAGFQVRHGIVDFSGQQPFSPVVTHQAKGGVILSFWRRGVALNAIDIAGDGREVARSIAPPRWRFFYQLQPGETWSVTKRGAVAIK